MILNRQVCQLSTVPLQRKNRDFSCKNSELQNKIKKMADMYKRYEKSLGLLTTRFVTLLKKAKDGVLDLKIVSISRLD